MPYKKKSFKKGKAKKDRKKKPGKKYTWGTVPRAIAGIAESSMVKFKYSTNKALSSITGIAQTYQMNGNSLYDPDRTNIGNNSGFFLQYSNIYTSYLVKGCAIKIRYLNTSTTVPMMCVLIPYPDTTIPSPAFYDDYQEFKYARTRIACIQGSGSELVSLKGYISTKKINGLDDKLSNSNVDYAGKMGASGNNPSKTWTWYFVAYPAANTSVSTAAVVNIKVTQYVELFKPVLYTA